MAITSPLTADRLLGPGAERGERLARLAAIFTKSNSILSGQSVKVRIETNDWACPPAPAWSDGQNIWFKGSDIRDADFDSIVNLYGLNYHELGHILWTPRQSHPLATWAWRNRHWSTMNLLEDQRIETAMTRRWPSTAPWLTACVLRWVLADPKTLSTSYLLLRGRRFLPADVRGLSRQAFERQDLLPEVDRIVDAYRELRFPEKPNLRRVSERNLYDRAQALITDYSALIASLNNQPTSSPNHGNDETSPVTNGYPAPHDPNEANTDDQYDDEPQPGQGSDGDQNDQHDDTNDSGAGTPCCSCDGGSH